MVLPSQLGRTGTIFRSCHEAVTRGGHIARFFYSEHPWALCKEDPEMQPKHPRNTLMALALLGLLVPAYAGEDLYLTTVVTATAYNSVVSQCDDDPSIAAWGDRLQPGVKAVAVSPDLIPRGLSRNAKVRIYGMPGEFVVLDKMHPRWENRIDIYMGEDVKAAKQFGKRKVRIYWSS